MICSHCGCEISNDSKFCRVCGKPANAPVEQQPAMQRPANAPVEQQPAMQRPAEAPVEQQPAMQRPAEAPVEQQPAMQRPAQNSLRQKSVEQQSSQVAVQQQPAQAPIEQAGSAKAKMKPKKIPTEATPKKKKKWVLPVVISLAVILIAGVFAGLFFFTDIFASGDGKCDICEAGISKKETYCESCLQSHTCKDCGNFNPDNVDGYCPDCRKCRNCSEDVQKGYYCESCIDTLTKSYPEPFCKSCYIEAFDGNYATLEVWAYSPENKLSAEDIYWIDTNGYFYCRECETENHCKNCEGFLNKNDDDDICIACAYDSDDHKVCECCEKEVISREDKTCPDCTQAKNCTKCGRFLPVDDDDSICYYCANRCCNSCREVLSENETVYQSEAYGYTRYTCEDCYSGESCSKCDAPLNNNLVQRGQELCQDCGVYCNQCGRTFSESEIAYEYKQHGILYSVCEECDSGKRCEECDMPLDIFDVDTLCSDCAEYACWACSEVLKKTEISYKLNENTYYCQNCDSGHYCTECEAVLSKTDNDDVCYRCAEYCCYNCYEVLDSNDIDYSYTDSWGDEYFCCKDCNTGKYCDDCGGMLSETDDDDVCSNCAEYACWRCDEVLKKSEVSYTEPSQYDGDSEYYYCEDCDSGKYCDDCGKMLGKTDDDDVCYDCAEYTCVDCMEVLTRNEIDYSYTADWGTEYYYCENCNTGKYCDDCGDMLAKSDDDDICSNCAEYACWRCDEVLKKSEVSYTEPSQYDGDSEYYYCEDCDSGKYCDDCGKMLGKTDDDDVCYDCAEYTCVDCMEVLTRNEIDYSYTADWGTECYYCENCNTGKYCDDCGRMLAKSDDDDICYNCAEYYCDNCYEVLSEDDYSHTDDAGNKYFFCEECNSTVMISSSDITGTYTFSGAEMDGVEVPMEGAPEMGVILAADGTVTLTSEGEAETGTWALDGDELILTSDEGDVMTMTLEDGNLVIEESGMKMIFSK